MRVLSLGVHRRVYSGRCLHIPRFRGSPVSAGVRNGVRISRRIGRAAGAEARPEHGSLMPQVRRIIRAGTAGGHNLIPLEFYQLLHFPVRNPAAGFPVPSWPRLEPPQFLVRPGGHAC